MTCVCQTGETPLLCSFLPTSPPVTFHTQPQPRRTCPTAGATLLLRRMGNCQEPRPGLNRQWLTFLLSCTRPTILVGRARAGPTASAQCQGAKQGGRAPQFGGGGQAGSTGPRTCPASRFVCTPDRIQTPSPHVNERGRPGGIALGRELHPAGLAAAPAAGDGMTLTGPRLPMEGARAALMSDMARTPTICVVPCDVTGCAHQMTTGEVFHRGCI